LTLGYEPGRIGDSKTDEEAALNWIVWWAKVRGKNPKGWLQPRYFDGLSVVVPGLKPAHRPDKEKGKAGKEGRKKRQGVVESRGAVFRGLICGALSAFTFWLLYESPIQDLDLPWAWRSVILWSVIAVSGPILIPRFGWALKTAPWGIAVGLALHFSGLTGVATSTFWMVGAWAAIGAGFFIARKADGGAFTGAFVGAVVWFGYKLIVGEIIGISIPWPPLAVGLFTAVFWIAQYIPETRDLKP
ncbi:MAG: hypothetical protein ACYTFG_05480, partial [Planctomycetota bacterium]